MDSPSTFRVLVIIALMVESRTRTAPPYLLRYEDTVRRHRTYVIGKDPNDTLNTSSIYFSYKKVKISAF